jgi:hypothetical protein
LDSPQDDLAVPPCETADARQRWFARAVFVDDTATPQQQKALLNVWSRSRQVLPLPIATSSIAQD